MEMKDLGYKMSDEGIAAPGDRKDKTTYYPSIHISKNVPGELMDKEVGDMCRLEVVAKIVSKNISEGESGEKESITIDVHKLGYIGKAGKVTKEEYLNKSKEARDEYDKKEVMEKDEE